MPIESGVFDRGYYNLFDELSTANAINANHTISVRCIRFVNTYTHKHTHTHIHTDTHSHSDKVWGKIEENYQREILLMNNLHDGAIFKKEFYVKDENRNLLVNID